jgi:hypothetical protein
MSHGERRPGGRRPSKGGERPCERLARTPLSSGDTHGRVEHRRCAIARCSTGSSSRCICGPCCFVCSGRALCAPKGCVAATEAATAEDPAAPLVRPHGGTPGIPALPLLLLRLCSRRNRQVWVPRCVRINLVAQFSTFTPKTFILPSFLEGQSSTSRQFSRLWGGASSSSETSMGSAL